MQNPTDKPAVYIVPRWAGRSDSDWYPWLTQKLTALGYRPKALDLPTPDCPIISEWAAGIASAVGTDPEVLAGTHVITHSAGCQALLQYLADLPDGARLAGTLMVAAWFDLDEPWETIQPWVDARPDWARARAAVRDRRVLLSDNDQFTADWARTRRDWEDRFGATVTVHSGGKHFNEPEEPAVLAAVESWLGAAAGPA